jgi:hypothetical protein
MIAGAAGIGVMAFVVLAAVRIAQRPAPTSDVSPVQQNVVSALDISAMSPQERAARLFARVMRLHEQQKFDSLAFFTPMALAAYGAIPNIDDDSRYDMARIAMIAGALPLARAQRDTILQRNPTQLLGMLLAADLARSASNETDAKRIETTFATAAKRERARALPEYKAHEEEIAGALKRFGAASKS